MENENKWVLHHGIHRHTITSRDSGAPEPFNSEAEALDALEAHRRFYRSIGYVIWFAELTAPDGTKRRLEQNIDY